MEQASVVAKMEEHYLRFLDELFDGIWNIFDEPCVLVSFGSGQNTSCVWMFHIRSVGVRIAMNVGEASAHCCKNSFRSTGVPFLAARTSEDVGGSLSFHQQHHLYHTHNRIKFRKERTCSINQNIP